MADIQFHSNWNIWYHHSLNDWSVNGYKNIFSIKSIEQFWNFNNNIDCLGGINNLHFFLMRDNITPIWEDINNRNGGSWSVLVPIEEAYTIWEQLTVDIVGETLINKPLLITGLSINQKNNISIIKIWNNDKNIKDLNLLPSYIHKYGNAIYRPHKVKS